MRDQDNKPRTAKDLEDTAVHVLDANDGLLPDEHLYLGVYIGETVRYLEDGTPVYRRVRITDAMAHPGAVESLVRHTAEDLANELHPTADRTARRVS